MTGTTIFSASRQCAARCDGGRDRRQSALPSCQEQPHEAAHLCELHVPSRQLDTAAQRGGAARMLAASRCRECHLDRQMENLIKLHKAQLASDRMSCHSATANQVRLVLHTAAFWLMHGVRAAIPRTNPLANCEFATLRERLIKIGARVIEHIARIRVQLPTSCPEGALFRAVALGLLPSGP